MRCLRLLIVDLALVALTTVIAFVLQQNFDISAAEWLHFVPYLVASVAAAALVVPSARLHRAVWRFSGLTDYLRIIVAVCATVLLAVACTFVYDRLAGIARSLPVLQTVLMISGLIGARVATRVRHDLRIRPRLRSSILTAGELGEPVLLVGWGNGAELFIQSVADLGKGRVRIVGLLAPLSRQPSRMFQAVKVLGVPEAARDVVARLHSEGTFVRRIVVANRLADLSEQARQALLTLETTSDVVLDVLPNRIASNSPAQAEPVTGPATDREPIRAAAFIIDGEELERILRRPYWRVKRFADAAAALALLIVLSPLIGLVAVLVAFDVGLPTMFWQQRPGHFGKPFRVYKFRTMGAAHDRDGRRIPDELRLSLTGWVLRRTRLDELPQLVNILLGDMSFVGPRPLLPIDQPAEYAARLLARPGLTGWAQLRGGRIVSPGDKAALDVWYVQNASFWLDLRIIAGTVPMVIHGEQVDQEAVRLAWRDLRNSGICGRAESTTPASLADRPAGAMLNERRAG